MILMYTQPLSKEWALSTPVLDWRGSCSYVKMMVTYALTLLRTTLRYLNSMTATGW